MPVEKTPERTAADIDPALAQINNGFDQGQVRRLSEQRQDLDRELLQGRNAPATRLRGVASRLIPALQPLDRRRHADLETLCCLASRRTGLHSCANARLQVTRIVLRDPSTHKRRINSRDSLIPSLLGIPKIELSRIAANRRYRSRPPGCSPFCPAGTYGTKNLQRFTTPWEVIASAEGLLRDFESRVPASRA